MNSKAPAFPNKLQPKIVARYSFDSSSSDISGLCYAENWLYLLFECLTA